MPKHKSAWTRPAALLTLSGLILTGCQSAPPVTLTTVDAACAGWRPILYSWDDGAETTRNEIDTPETVQMIQAMNAYMEGVCKHG